MKSSKCDSISYVARNRDLFIRVDFSQRTTKSSCRKVKHEIHQGSSLGLFLIYINDLPYTLKFSTPGFYADNKGIHLKSVDSNTQGTKNMFELANVRIIESCHKNSSRPSEWKKNTKSAFLHWSISTGYTVKADRLHAFFIF